MLLQVINIKSLIDDTINSGNLKCYKRYDINKCYTSDECYKVVKTRDLALFISKKKSEDPTYPVPLPEWLEKHIKEEANNQEMLKNKCGEPATIVLSFAHELAAKANTPLTFSVLIRVIAKFFGIKMSSKPEKEMNHEGDIIRGLSFDSVSRLLKSAGFSPGSASNLPEEEKIERDEQVQELLGICSTPDFEKFKTSVSRLTSVEIDGKIKF